MVAIVKMIARTNIVDYEIYKKTEIIKCYNIDCFNDAKKIMTINNEKVYLCLDCYKKLLPFKEMKKYNIRKDKQRCLI